MARAGTVQPLDASGAPSPTGKIVLLSIGMSNTSDEWCGTSPDCTSASGASLMKQAEGSAAVNHTTLAIVNGAQGGQDAKTWTSPTSPNYDMVKNQRLAPLGLTEKQVQVIWLKEADANPSVSLPSSSADAYTLEENLGKILRSIRVRYPNIKMVFLTSRIYGGYATDSLNPEPYAYESGFAVKWLIQAQIDQMRQGIITDPHAGNLDYNTVAPWIAWGPYLWANGATPRSDGLSWLRSDFQSDGTHPSASGIQKVGDALLSFFLTSPYTTCWFTATGCTTPGTGPTPTTTPTPPSTVQPGPTGTADPATIMPTTTATATATSTVTATATAVPTGTGTPPAPPSGTLSPTPTLPPVPSATPTASPTATSGPAPLTLQLQPEVAAGKKQMVSISGPASAQIHMRVEYPNGDHQSAAVQTDADGHATYSYTQGASKITHKKFVATVTAKTGTGADRESATATYRIGFGVIDVSAEPRTVRAGQTVDFFVHARTGSHVAISIVSPNGRTLPRVFTGTTGPKGFASIKLRLPPAAGKQFAGRKIKVIARFASGKPSASTSTTFTVK
jgi:hypothetical protein